MRKLIVFAVALASTSVSATASAQSNNPPSRVYVEQLPCGGMDCSYSPEQQARLRQGEELQALMTEFVNDLTRYSNTQGWGSDYDDLDSNIGILETNLSNLDRLRSTAGRIDQLWAELNGGSRGPASAERLQGYVDSTRQALSREREIRTIHQNAVRANVQFSTENAAAPDIAVPESPPRPVEPPPSPEPEPAPVANRTQASGPYSKLGCWRSTAPTHGSSYSTNMVTGDVGGTLTFQNPYALEQRYEYIRQSDGIYQRNGAGRYEYGADGTLTWYLEGIDPIEFERLGDRC